MKQLRVGLLGAPGTGKAEVTRHFVRYALSATGLENKIVWPIENPGRILAEELDLAVGSFATYREDLWAMFLMFQEERGYQRNNASYVTSGTPLGTLAHAVANMEALGIGLQTPLVQAEAMARQYTLAVLTMLAIEDTNYNFVFRMPWPEEQPEGMDDFDWYYGGKFERALTPTLEQLGLRERIQTLKSGTPEEQASEMIETIQALYDRIPDSDDSSPATVSSVVDGNPA